MSNSQIKQTLRQQMKNRRDDLSEIVRKRAAVAVANNLMGNIPFNRQDIIAFYWPITSEIDLTLMAEALMEQGHICCLPVIVAKDKPLIFRQYHKGQELKRSKVFNVMQPPDGAREVKPTIIIMPLLAFDVLGNRLGYGGGFYDRTLAIYKTHSNFMSIGVGYDFMQVAKIPTDKYDQNLDCVVTQKRVVVCS